MGNRFSAPEVDNAVKASTSSLLDLPMETILEVTSCLDKDSIKALRSTCKFMDLLLLDAFGKQTFSSVFVIPTKHALDTLIQMSESKRIASYVKDLHICCSVFQWREKIHDATNSPRRLKEGGLPFIEPKTPEEEAANQGVDLVRSGGFGKQLIKALRSLKITAVEIQPYEASHVSRSLEVLRLGRSHLLRLTGRDIFQEPKQDMRRAWEYRDYGGVKSMDMVTCMASVVLAAVEETLSPVTSLRIPAIQVDRLRVSETLGAKLIHLHELHVRLNLVDRSFAGHSIPSICRMINALPALQTLSLDTTRLERLNPYTLSLHPFLPHLQPSSLRSLRLGSLCDASALLVPFLSSLTHLTSLSLNFILIRDRGNGPWRHMFLALNPILCRPALQNLELSIDWQDGFKLVADMLQEEALGSEDEEEEEDEWVEGYGYIRKEKQWLRPSREDMVACLARRMPYYHDTVFRRCRMFFT